MALAKTSLRYILFTTLMVLSVSCDQGTKIWARDALPGRSISVIDGYWDFHLAQNPNGAFSLLRNVPGKRVILTVIGLGLLTAMFFWLRKTVHQGTLACVALALLAGGAIGNLSDRIVLGSVTDFVYWHGRTWSWPVFNVADALLLVGIGLMLIGGRAPKAKPATS
jgi:signal peptidase II